MAEADEPIRDVVGLEPNVFGFKFLVRPPVTDGRSDEHTLAGEDLEQRIVVLDWEFLSSRRRSGGNDGCVVDCGGRPRFRR